MSKLEQYLVEKRNIQSDIGKIKKMFKDYIKQRNNLRVKIMNDVNKHAKSVHNSIDADEFVAFRDELLNWLMNIDDQIREPDLETMFYDMLSTIERS